MNDIPHYRIIFDDGEEVFRFSMQEVNHFLQQVVRSRRRVVKVDEIKPTTHKF